jgi:hypothetical protein
MTQHDDYSEDSDERLVDSYAQSLLAQDPAFRALAEPMKHELLKRLFRGRTAYAAVRKATASVAYGRPPFWLPFILGIGAAVLGLMLGGGLR